MGSKNKKKKYHRNLRTVLKYDVDIGLNGRKAQILGLIVAVFMICFVVFNKNLFFLEDERTAAETAVFVFSILAGPLAGLFIAFHYRVKEGRLGTIVYAVVFLLMPIASMQMMECFNGKFVYNFSIPTYCLNYLAYLFVYLLLFLIIGRMHWAVLISNIFLLVLGYINYFVDLFRGTPFVPLDITTIATGMEVADGYEYSLSWQLITASIVFVLIYLLNRYMVDLRGKHLRGKLLMRVFPAAYVVITFCLLMFTDVLPNNGYKPDFWNQSRGYHKTGTWLNFCMNLRYLIVEEPEDYDAEEVDDILYGMLEDYGVDADSDTSLNILTGENDYTASDVTPNVICIMNESLSDLADATGNLETDEDYFPFIHSMEENTIQGTAQVPVFGAGTSNTEFEFLTGISVQFLPAGSNAYQLYVNAFTPSLVSTLADQGYSKTAYHPYYAAGWNRIAVYHYLGFEDFISIEDFIDEDILTTYEDNNDAYEYQQMLEEAYPDEDILLRRFVSDSYDYEMIIDMFEEKDDDEQFFVFNVTMQNHGGYTMSYSNFDEDQIEILSPEGDYEKADRYVSLMKESDAAFEELIEYFEDVDEPTIICMFGDHQASLETEFYEALYDGQDLDELDLVDLQTRYETPFIIWANYDIEEAQLGNVSVNYLATILCQAAGLELTDFQKYLACLYQELPVLDAVGYIDSEGNYYDYDDETTHTSTILDYQRICYNALIDTENRDLYLYTLSGEDTSTAQEEE